MKVWSNTNTLDGYLDGVEFTKDKAVADVALIGGKPLDLVEFPALKGIFKTGVGTDNIPFEAAKARNVAIRLPSAETSDWIFEETANFACYLTLRLMYDSAGIFETWTKFPRTSIRNRTLLVVGAGNIGRRVRDKMSAFCNVITYDAAVDPANAMQERFAQADFISLHVPLIEQTKSLINAEKLSWMKPGAAIINTARGPVIDEQALFDSLVNGHIRAAIDVYWKEPYEGILKQIPSDRLLMTPHIASTCDEFLQGCAKDFLEFCSEFK
ncbi:NAD(P)-dependent oxidoreductase [Planctomicrobium sp. SH668]|uniref:NAD(P)-dependent oxidoreductase n=1 Tax=Planctomicrobium sp. SH668 TaxID=3448126 RepID=UPI003F5C11DE